MIEITSIQGGLLNLPSCTIAPGWCAITGPNGAGKTTFLRLLSGMLRPSTGKISIDGKDPCACTIGWVGEYPDRNMLFTRVYDELAAPLRFGRHSCASIDEKVRICANELSITHLLEHTTSYLSEGERIVVACGTACINHPDLLILDETDSHLDEDLCHHLDVFIRKKKIPYVIYSTHQPSRIAVADELIRLEKGRITEQRSLTEEPELAYPDMLQSPWLWRRILFGR